jgi:hypothetical protein
MSAHGWKALFELGRQEKKSKLEDDDRVKTIMDYLLEKAPKSCFDAAKTKELKCKCLSCLDNESLRTYVALWTMWFARLEKETQEMLLTWRKSVQQGLYWVMT